MHVDHEKLTRIIKQTQFFFRHVPRHFLIENMKRISNPFDAQGKKTNRAKKLPAYESPMCEICVKASLAALYSAAWHLLHPFQSLPHAGGKRFKRHALEQRLVRF